MADKKQNLPKAEDHEGMYRLKQLNNGDNVFVDYYGNQYYDNGRMYNAKTKLMEHYYKNSLQQALYDINHTQSEIKEALKYSNIKSPVYDTFDEYGNPVVWEKVPQDITKNSFWNDIGMMFGDEYGWKNVNGSITLEEGKQSTKTQEDVKRERENYFHPIKGAIARALTRSDNGLTLWHALNRTFVPAAEIAMVPELLSRAPMLWPTIKAVDNR